MKTKRILSAAVGAAIFLGTLGTNVGAYDFPHAFWAAQAGYENAVNSGDNKGIIDFGSQVVNIMSGAPEGTEKHDIIVTRYNQIALAYAAIGDYNNSAYIFNALCSYAEPFGDKYSDYVKGARAKALQYAPAIELYTEGGTAPYYGAKNEKKNGVLFGVCQNGETRSKLQNESMTLVYQEFGQPLLPYNETVMRDASEKGLAVEFALNCPNEGGDIRSFSALSYTLDELSALFSRYPATPVYLRFGAEFDVWTDMAEPEQFKTAFRAVSQHFKSKNSNVAIVWSPNQVSGWNTDTNDFYPGDEYVDWVGLSLYAQKYFLGDPNSDPDSQVFFRTGINSDPVLAVKWLVDTYGDRKPIMISESGCGHRLTSTGEDTSDFALRRLREYYSYLPMVYPQIKLMAYFDYHVDKPGEKNDFRLSSCPALQNEYLSITRGDRFIHGGYNSETGLCYRKIGNGMSLGGVFPVSCYTHKYGVDAQNVTYYIDGKYAAAADKAPFTAYINANAYTGAHTLKAVAAFSDGQTLSTESAVYINGSDGNITVTVSGSRVTFDQNPVMYNDRTLVPMRKIFEELGATVSWDENTQTASGTKNGKTVSLTVGSRTMNVGGTEITLDTPPIVLSDRTLVPARAVAEGMGCNVNWDGASNTVIITEK